MQRGCAPEYADVRADRQSPTRRVVLDGHLAARTRHRAHTRRHRHAVAAVAVVTGQRVEEDDAAGVRVILQTAAEDRHGERAASGLPRGFGRRAGLRTKG